MRRTTHRITGYTPPPLNQEGDVISHPMIGEGLWAVTATCMTGGGTAMGPHDVYPDGHQVTLRPLTPWNTVDWKDTKRKKFFQSGAFNQILPYCKPCSHL